MQVALSATPIETVERRMAKLFLMFPAAGLSGEATRATAQAYAGVLSSFPVWAIDRACQKVIASGETFRPSAPEIRKLVVAECKFAFAEEDDLRVILTAERYEPREKSDRDRVKIGLAQLRAVLEKSCHPWRKTSEEAERDIASGFAHLQGPLSATRVPRSFDEARA